MTIVAHAVADTWRVRLSPRIVVTIALVVVVLGVLWVFAPSFFKLNNLVNILVQASTLAVLAIGMSVVMIGGGIDLSLPFNAALSAVLGAMYMRATGDAMGGPLIMIAAALCIGTLNGAAVGYLGMIPGRSASRIFPKSSSIRSSRAILACRWPYSSPWWRRSLRSFLCRVRSMVAGSMPSASIPEPPSLRAYRRAGF